LFDIRNFHLTHFTGFMLEEEIVASLWGSTSSATRNIFDLFIGDHQRRHEFFGGNSRGKGR
jgi:hypothetical protein